jgi:hypothetical protein
MTRSSATRPRTRLASDCVSLPRTSDPTPASSQRHPGTSELDPAERRTVVARPLDGVEVGDIERCERIDREQAARDVERIAGRRERRRDRPIEVTLSHAGAHHHAVLEIENRNDLHRVPAENVQTRSTPV